MVEPLSFWEFCQERINVFHKRFILKQEPPFSTNKILEDYHWTWYARELDRTTLWFITHVLREDGAEEYPEDLLFSTLLMRWTNRPETYSLILNACLDDGGETTTALSPKEFLRNRIRIVKALRDAEFSIWSHAYTIVSHKAGVPKYESIVNDLWTPIAKNPKKYLTPIVEANNPQQAFDAIGKLPWHGGTGFMKYEEFCDISYSSYFMDRWQTDSEQSICNAGPGCIKGLKFVFPDQTAVQDEDFGSFSKNYFWFSWIQYLHNQQPKFDNLYQSRKLSLRGCEHLLCEYGKFRRLYEMIVNSGKATHQRKFLYNKDRDKEYLDMLGSQQFQDLYSDWRRLSPEGFV